MEQLWLNPVLNPRHRQIRAKVMIHGISVGLQSSYSWWILFLYRHHSSSVSRKVPNFDQFLRVPMGYILSKTDKFRSSWLYTHGPLVSRDGYQSVHTSRQHQAPRNGNRNSRAQACHCFLWPSFCAQYQNIHERAQIKGLELWKPDTIFIRYNERHCSWLPYHVGSWR